VRAARASLRSCALLLAAAAPASLAPHGQAADAPPARAARAAATPVSIGDNYFKPRKVRVRRGASVTWRWRGSRRHNVYFTSGTRRPRTCAARRTGRCTRRFGRAGVYGYVCTFHGSMTGRVVVRRP
jgi:plastocyanin